MSKPHWELLHEWKLDDVRFELEQIWAFKKMLKRHPDDRIGECFREIIKGLKKCLIVRVKAYEAVYGDKPDITKMRREVEKC